MGSAHHKLIYVGIFLMKNVYEKVFILRDTGVKGSLHYMITCINTVQHGAFRAVIKGPSELSRVTSLPIIQCAPLLLSSAY